MEQWLHSFWNNTQYIVTFSLSHEEIWSTLLLLGLFYVLKFLRKRRKSKKEKNEAEPDFDAYKKELEMKYGSVPIQKNEQSASIHANSENTRSHEKKNADLYDQNDEVEKDEDGFVSYKF